MKFPVLLEQAKSLGGWASILSLSLTDVRYSAFPPRAFQNSSEDTLTEWCYQDNGYKPWTCWLAATMGWPEVLLCLDTSSLWCLKMVEISTFLQLPRRRLQRWNVSECSGSQSLPFKHVKLFIFCAAAPKGECKFTDRLKKIPCFRLGSWTIWSRAPDEQISSSQR